ncbi:conserved hypothetical protein [Burkholderia vietnamiensis]|nr:conserved hypothetical protein [Burkholderia vietnamiensis]
MARDAAVLSGADRAVVVHQPRFDRVHAHRRMVAVARQAACADPASMGAVRPDLAQPEARTDRIGGRDLRDQQRLRRRRDPAGVGEEQGARPHRRRRLDDHAAARAQSVPVAREELHPQGAGADHHVDARNGARQGAHLRDLPEFGRMGPRRLRRRGRRPLLLPDPREPARRVAVGAPRGDAAEAALVRRASRLGLSGAARRNHRAPDGRGRAAAIAVSGALAPPQRRSWRSCADAAAQRKQAAGRPGAIR